MDEKSKASLLLLEKRRALTLDRLKSIRDVYVSLKNELDELDNEIKQYSSGSGATHSSSSISSSSSAKLQPSQIQAMQPWRTPAPASVTAAAMAAAQNGNNQRNNINTNNAAAIAKAAALTRTAASVATAAAAAATAAEKETEKEVAMRKSNLTNIGHQQNIQQKSSSTSSSSSSNPVPSAPSKPQVQQQPQQQQQIVKPPPGTATTKAVLVAKEYLSTCKPFVLEKPSTEPNTKLRIYDSIFTEDTLALLFEDRAHIPIDKILHKYNGEVMNGGDWISIGVVYFIFPKILETHNGKKQFIVYWVTDLRGGYFRLFLCGKAMQLRHSDPDDPTKGPLVPDQTVLGSVIALLNPSVMPPSQSGASIGLGLESEEGYLHLGKSRDLGWCKTPDCREILDVVAAKDGYCPSHRDANYRAARAQRAEMGVGNSLFQVEAPQSQEDIKLEKKKRCMTRNGTYKLYGQTVAAEGFRLTVHKPVKPTTQRADKEQIEAIVNMQGRGADMVRATLGIEKAQAPTMAEILGPIALARMGGNPKKEKGDSPSKPTLQSPSKPSPSKFPSSSTKGPSSPLIPNKRRKAGSSGGGREERYSDEEEFEIVLV